MSTESDRILHAVLDDAKLTEYGGYKESDYTDMTQALRSDNYVVSAVAQIIKLKRNGASENEMYKQLNQFLKERV